MKSLKKNIWLLFGSTILAFLVIVIGPDTSSQPIEAKTRSTVEFDFPADGNSFFVGEELQYNVSYSFFDIGLVKLQILDTAVRNGTKVFKAKAFLDSYSGLPFVNLHQVFYTEMNSEAFSQFFITHTTTKPDVMPFTRYIFDYNNNSMQYEIGSDPGGVIKKSGTVEVKEQQIDGLSLFYYARKNFRQESKYSIPVFANEKSFKTHFNFMNKIGKQEIGAVKYPVEIIEFDGSSDFTGVFGLTGYFRGFFSNDDAGIPIVAKMKVILGNVHIELIKWTRPGWIPPRAK